MNESTDARICYLHDHRQSRGWFFGDSPFSFDTPLLLIQLSLSASVTATLQRFFTPLGQSVFISQILAGFILGPSLLGKNLAFKNLIFPVSSFYIVDTFAYFGVMFFLFIIGVKTDLSLIQKSGKKAVAIGVGAFLTPLLFNFVLGEFLIYSTPMEPRLHRSILWIGSFQALSSFHVIVCLLADLKLMNSELGRLAISSSMISGMCSWIWAGIVFTGRQGVRIKKWNTFILMLLFLGIMVLLAVFVFRPIVLWMARSTSNGKSLRESHVTAIFVMVLLSALFGEFFGQHFLFGPVILGLLVPDGPPLGSALVNKLELFVSSIILPIFFVVSGARLDFSAISLRNFAIIEFLAIFALIWKVGGVMLPSIYCKMPIPDAFYLGLIFGNQGIIEVLVLEHAQSLELIDRQSYSIMVLSIVLFTGILAPILKFLYNPSKRYTSGEAMTIQYANQFTELRVLACVHYPDHTPSILNLFEATNPDRQSPICFYVVHLLDLGGRSAPVLVAHQPGARNSHSHESEHIINALRFFEHENRGNVTIYPFTAISPYASMHDDICLLAAEKRVCLVIVLFHKHPLIHVPEVEANSIRAVNHNIINNSPCSVGILFDRGAMNCNASILSRTEVYQIGVFFLGGPDDREALAYACRMAKHPNICLTLVRFVDDDMGNYYMNDVEQDIDIINEYREANVKDEHSLYREESVKDSMGLISVVRSIERSFNLILVGRRHDENSPLLAGLNDWNEFPELGCIGDMLVSLDSDSKVSILVVQQALSIQNGFDEYFGQDSSAILDMNWNDVRVWPASRGPM
ncbi:hypothetical protein RD792_010253 [Penstemon davidsonii]|uniref:Cation/H+ exchanger domain-containing protein n=1 Tax=Penstemon davidsonii TaxID=160366 RepID=A0ABR0D1J2_9LAMI|nr:hypothetical protein RD792_010253 [Penstemon davidsonii]